jgi:hypothetical protein
MRIGSLLSGKAAHVIHIVFSRIGQIPWGRGSTVTLLSIYHPNPKAFEQLDHSRSPLLVGPMSEIPHEYPRYPTSRCGGKPIHRGHKQLKACQENSED